MPIRNDLELQRLEAEVSRLADYVAPHELFKAWLALVSVSLSFAAAAFVLAGWIQGEVRVVNLMLMTILAGLIVYAATWEFRLQGRTFTIGRVIGQLVARVAAVPDDLDDARMRLVVCRARIAQLKRSRR